MKKFFQGFFREEEGQGMAEYALVLGVIAVGVIVVLAAFGDQIKNVFENISANFGENVPGADDSSGS